MRLAVFYFTQETNSWHSSDCIKIQKSFGVCVCVCLTEMCKNEARLFSTEDKSVLTAWFANEDFLISLFGRHFSIIRIRWNLQLQSSDKSIFKGIYFKII